jgi:phosphoribosylamine--glycine ligase
MASGGYPGKYEKGKEILGTEVAAQKDGIFVFHAGTKKDAERLMTDGGRVLNVVSVGKDIKNAIDKVYRACDKIAFDGAHYRKDIGYRALKRETCKN